MSQAAIKALALVEIVSADATEGIGAMEAAIAAGLDKTTASRLLKVLTDQGWFMRDPESRRYFPGRVLTRIAWSSAFAQHTRNMIDELLEQLRDVGETVVMHQRTGSSRLCVAGYESHREVRIGLSIGQTRPLSTGTAGKVILAFCDEAVRDEVVAQVATADERDELLAATAWTREHGYLSAVSSVTGSGTLTVPLFDRFDVHGSLTLAGPANRFDGEQRLAQVPRLLAVARQISDLFGSRIDRYDAWEAQIAT